MPYMIAFLAKKNSKKTMEKIAKTNEKLKETEEKSQITKVAISMTFCDRGENHTGMKGEGRLLEVGEGLNKKDLIKGKKLAKKWGLECKLLHLNDLLSPEDMQRTKGDGTIETGVAEDAYVLVIRGFVDAIMARVHKTKWDLFKEMNSATWDTMYYDTRRKKVLNKRARSNNVITDRSCEANFEEKQGTLIDFKDLPLLSMIRGALYELFGEKCKDFVAEGNRYEDGGTKKHGIGWHGDAERFIVACIRLGMDPSMIMYYQWYWRNAARGKKLGIRLGAGDLYVMSEIATGHWWRSSTKFCPRHATGAPKYVK
jgi:alkylated DNA repair dioxygenase AlkB